MSSAEDPARPVTLSLMVNDLWSVDSEPPKSPARAGGSTPVVAARRSTAGRHAPSDVGMATALVVGLLLVGVTAWVARSDRFTRAPSESAEPVVAASPVAPAPPAPTSVAPASTGAEEATSVELPPAPAPPASPATVGAVRAPRPVARQPERPARVDQPSADGGDGTAIIDWLLKGGRSGG